MIGRIVSQMKDSIDVNISQTDVQTINSIRIAPKFVRFYSKCNAIAVSLAVNENTFKYWDYSLFHMQCNYCFVCVLGTYLDIGLIKSRWASLFFNISGELLSFVPRFIKIVERLVCNRSECLL